MPHTGVARRELRGRHWVPGPVGFISLGLIGRRLVFPEHVVGLFTAAQSDLLQIVSLLTIAGLLKHFGGSGFPITPFEIVSKLLQTLNPKLTTIASKDVIRVAGFRVWD